MSSRLLLLLCFLHIISYCISCYCTSCCTSYLYRYLYFHPWISSCPYVCPIPSLTLSRSTVKLYIIPVQRKFFHSPYIVNKWCYYQLSGVTNFHHWIWYHEYTTYPLGLVCGTLLSHDTPHFPSSWYNIQLNGYVSVVLFWAQKITALWLLQFLLQARWLFSWINQWEHSLVFQRVWISL